MVVMRTMFVSAAVMALALFAPQRSEAGFKLNIGFGASINFDLDAIMTAGPTTVTGANGFRFTSVSSETIGDNSTVTFVGLRVGNIVNSGSSGLYRFGTLTLATTSPGSIDSALLSLEYTGLTRESTTANNLTFALTDTDYTNPPSPLILTTAFSAAQNSVLNTETAVISTPGGEFDLSGTTLSQTGTGYTVSKSTGIFPYSPTFSLTNTGAFTSAGTGSASISTSGSINSIATMVTPAPAAAFMALSALPLIAVALRRRRKDSTEALAV
jgi:hypothetical protein